MQPVPLLSTYLSHGFTMQPVILIPALLCSQILHKLSTHPDGTCSNTTHPTFKLLILMRITTTLTTPNPWLRCLIHVKYTYFPSTINSSVLVSNDPPSAQGVCPCNDVTYSSPSPCTCVSLPLFLYVYLNCPLVYMITFSN